MLSRRLLRIKAIKSLYAHLQANDNNLIACEKGLLNSIDRSYDLYLNLLHFPTLLVEYAKNQHEIGKAKHLPSPEERNPNTKFVDNKVIQKIAEYETLQDIMESRKIESEKSSDIIKQLFKEMSESEYFINYMNTAERSYNADYKLLIDIYVHTIQHSEALETLLEEESILWNGELPHLLPSVVRTLSSIQKEESALTLMPKFKAKEDKEFVKTLLEKSLVNHAEHQKYIEKFTSNWDLERIVFMDNLIISFAMTEFVYMSSVPVKVTLDEYIDIAKEYSTRSSSTFINGVLDKISSTLNEEGRIKKNGRGLI